MRRVGILTISDRAAAGDYVDESGPAAAAGVTTATGWPIERQAVIPDDFDAIVRTLRQWCDDGLELVLTSGGTGFAPRDVTPEATRAVITREAPGYAETLRAQAREHTPLGILTRGVSGVAARTLIINFPGNPRAIAEAGEPLVGTLPHAMALLLDEPAGH